MCDMMEMENSSTIQGPENSDHASSGTIEQNDARTGEKIGTPLTQGGSLSVPANFDWYLARRDLYRRRAHTNDPIKREQINILIQQCDEFERAQGQLRADLADNITRQM